MKRRFSRNRQLGATMVEYGIAIVLIVVVVITAATSLGGHINVGISAVNQCLTPGNPNGEGCGGGPTGTGD